MYWICVCLMAVLCCLYIIYAFGAQIVFCNKIIFIFIFCMTFWNAVLNAVQILNEVTFQEVKTCKIVLSFLENKVSSLWLHCIFRKKYTGSTKDSGIRFLCHVGMQTDVELSTSTIKRVFWRLICIFYKKDVNTTFPYSQYNDQKEFW